jgi:hypothetical protein
MMYARAGTILRLRGAHFVRILAADLACDHGPDRTGVGIVPVYPGWTVAAVWPGEPNQVRISRRRVGRRILVSTSSRVVGVHNPPQGLVSACQGNVSRQTTPPGTTAAAGAGWRGSARVGRLPWTLQRSHAPPRVGAGHQTRWSRRPHTKRRPRPRPDHTQALGSGQPVPLNDARGAMRSSGRQVAGGGGGWRDFFYIKMKLKYRRHQSCPGVHSGSPLSHGPLSAAGRVLSCWRAIGRLSCAENA